MDAVREYVDTACGHLTAHGLDVEWPSGETVDIAGVMTISWQGRCHEFVPQVHRGLRLSTAALALENNPDPSGFSSLIIAERIVGELATLLRKSEINYVDLAGNTYLRSSDFLIDIQGQRSQVAPAREPRGLTKTDLRVALALITCPQLIGATTRQVSECVGVSRGAAHSGLIKLNDQGFISPRGLRHGTRLMNEWTHAYLARAGAYKTSRTLYADDGVDIAERLVGAGGIQLSGEAAAQELGWSIRATSAIVYGPTFASVARHLRGRSDGGDIPVQVRTPVLAPSDNQNGLAASLLIRADMLASGDPRQIEIAQDGGEHDANLRRLQQIA